MHRDQWLGFALPTERVEHAARSFAATRLLLLLRSDVYTVPDRVVNRDVLIGDVCDLST